MGMKSNGCGVFGFLVTLVGAGLLGASIGTTHWKTPNNNDVNNVIDFTTQGQTFGLLENCNTDANGERTCTFLGWGLELGVTLLATRIILLVAILLLLIGIMIGLAALCGSGNITRQGALNIVSGIFIWVACGCYTALTVLVERSVTNPPEVTEYGYSYYICWVSGLVLVFAGICGVNGKRKDNNEVHPATLRAQMVWATAAQPGMSTISQRDQHQMALIQAA